MHGHLNVIFIEICWKLMTIIWKYMCSDNIVLYDFIWKLERPSVLSGTVCCACSFQPRVVIFPASEMLRSREAVRLCPLPKSFFTNLRFLLRVLLLRICDSSRLDDSSNAPLHSITRTVYKTRMNEIAVSVCPSSYVVSGITVGEIWYC